jgi:hypothetical protein
MIVRDFIRLGIYLSLSLLSLSPDGQGRSSRVDQMSLLSLPHDETNVDLMLGGKNDS